jgi:SnoaL-like domain
VIERIYRDAAHYPDWSRQAHLMVAPGVGVCESVSTNVGAIVSTPPQGPYVSLLAVEGDKIAHEEIFYDTRSLPPRKAPVQLFGSAPGPLDTARAAAATGAAVGDALANGDPSALRAVVPPHVLLYDTAQGHGVRGWKAVLRWWTNVPDVELRNEEPVAGAGWVVDRWTVRRVLTSGEEKTMPGATVMEVRRGEVVRMTLYYESPRVMPLQLRGGERVAQ